LLVGIHVAGATAVMTASTLLLLDTTRPARSTDVGSTPDDDRIASVR
jgi:hypothetical protein